MAGKETSTRGRGGRIIPHISQFLWNLDRKISEMLAANHANLNIYADINAAATTLIQDRFCRSSKVKFPDLSHLNCGCRFRDLDWVADSYIILGLGVCRLRGRLVCTSDGDGFGGCGHRGGGGVGRLLLLLLLRRRLLMLLLLWQRQLRLLLILRLWLSVSLRRLLLLQR